MENQNPLSFQISCPLHPSETIQRVSLDKNANHHIYCLECILQQKSQPGEASQTFTPISELIDTAAGLYAKKRENVNFGDQIPYEMADFLSGQAEKLETLTQHIEEEKKRVSEIFDSLSQEILEIIDEMKTEALYKLDQQIFNLRFWFISFDKQLKKTYPTPEDIPILYPTKEALMSKLAKITNATQLTALVKGIKEDLNEAPTFLEGNKRALDLRRKAAIRNMSQQLLQNTQMRPSYQREDFDLEKLKQSLRKSVSGLMKQAWKIQNPVVEFINRFSIESAFLKAQDFDLIRSWLPQNLTFNPQLLYRGSRDGMDCKTFHKFCDGKRNTFTIIKAKFQDSDTISIIGGYLDKPWHSNGGFIHSTESFVFSVTKNVKCPLGKDGAQYAASANLNQGPCFGGGYDIGVWIEGQISSVYPFSYLKSHQLIESAVYKGTNPTTSMEVLDVEVYSVN